MIIGLSMAEGVELCAGGTHLARTPHGEQRWTASCQKADSCCSLPSSPMVKSHPSCISSDGKSGSMSRRFERGPGMGPGREMGLTHHDV